MGWPGWSPAAEPRRSKMQQLTIRYDHGTFPGWIVRDGEEFPGYLSIEPGVYIRIDGHLRWLGATLAEAREWVEYCQGQLVD